jgi:hypothetical protein
MKSQVRMVDRFIRLISLWQTRIPEKPTGRSFAEDAHQEGPGVFPAEMLEPVHDRYPEGVNNWRFY